MSNNPKHLIPSSPGLYPGRIEGRHAAMVLFKTDKLQALLNAITRDPRGIRVSRCRHDFQRIRIQAVVAGAGFKPAPTADS
ncbi:MAG: hypothetical protein OXC10_07200, partial [Rhodospirillaceae bacterium]|nr:hypothetical protein [Rhodospirillaceae bacterium]